MYYNDQQGAQQECCGSPEPPSEWNWNVIFTSGSHPAEQNRKKCDFIRIFGIFNIFVRAPPSHLWTDLEDSFTVRELSNHRFCAVHLLSRSDFIRRSYTEKNAILCHFSVFSISSNGHHRVIYKPIWTIPSPLESSRITDSTRYTFCSDPTSSRGAISKKRYFIDIFGIFTNVLVKKKISQLKVGLGW